MKKIDRTPTNDIVFDQNNQYVDNFANWLTEIVDYWAKNYSGCTFNIKRNDEKTIEVTTTKKDLTDTSNCQLNLETSLKTAKDKGNITIEKKSGVTGISTIITWIEGQDKKEEDKKEDKKDGVTTTTTTSSSFFGTLFGDVAKAAAKGLGLKENMNETQIQEEINRIKQLLK